MSTCFVTGTDTEVGKTLVSAGLLHLAGRQGLSTLGLKPVAAGCEPGAAGLRNADAELLRREMTLDLPYEQVNPVALAEPVAPHIAAARAGRRVSVERLAGICRGALARGADLALIEGAGGWRVPLNERETLADLARTLNCRVILVVGLRLGCINHALLSAEAILRDGLQLCGWVANTVDPGMAVADEVVDSLLRRLPAPCLGRLPWLQDATPAQAADYLSLAPLLAE